MASYPLLSRLSDAATLAPKPGVLTRIRQWFWKNAQPAAPQKPMSEMTDEEFEKVPLI